MPAPADLIAEIRTFLHQPEELVEIATETELAADEANAAGRDDRLLRRRANSLWDEAWNADIMVVNRLAQAEQRGLLAQWQSILTNAREGWQDER